MKKLLQVTCLAIYAVAPAQIPDIEWQQSFGGSGADSFTCIVAAADGGFLMGGASNGLGGDITEIFGNDDARVVKVDSQGVPQWQRSYGGAGYEIFFAATATDDGGYILGGYTTSGADGQIFGQTDLWIVKLDSDGQILWQKILGGSNHDTARAIEQVDGGYIVAGSTLSIDGDVASNHGDEDVWVMKLDPAGVIEWEKTLGGSGADAAYDMVVSEDESITIAGQTRSLDGDVSGLHYADESFYEADYWVAKLDASGNLIWQRALGGLANDVANSICRTADGGVVVAGTSASVDGDVTGNIGSYDFWIVKLDSAGGIEWQKSLGGSAYEECKAILQATDGGYLATGLAVSNDGDISLNHGSSDMWVVKLDASGNMEWEKTMGGTVGDYGFDATTSPDGYCIAGNTYSSDSDVTENNGDADAWIVKLGYPSGVEGHIKPSVFLYPNPVSDVLNIDYEIADDNTIYAISDIAGRTVLSGIIESHVNVSSLPAGMYLIRLSNTQHKFIKG